MKTEDFSNLLALKKRGSFFLPIKVIFILAFLFLAIGVLFYEGLYYDNQNSKYSMALVHAVHINPSKTADTNTPAEAHAYESAISTSKEMHAHEESISAEEEHTDEALTAHTHEITASAPEEATVQGGE